MIINFSRLFRGRQGHRPIRFAQGRPKFLVGFFVFVFALSTTLQAVPFGTSAATPSDFPGYPSSYSSLGTDDNENGCDDHRNVLEAFGEIVNATSGGDNFLFLRLQTENPAGWPSSNTQGDARYKWFFDTTGNDGVLSGGNVNNFEYMLGIEDPSDNTNDGMGEITLYNSALGIISGPVVGTGSIAPTGPQEASNTDFGYNIQGDNVDMYIRMSTIGSPTAFNVF